MNDVDKLMECMTCERLYVCTYEEEQTNEDANGHCIKYVKDEEVIKQLKGE